jgi:uncharacterized coiled-coil DUF342 family protein
MAEVNNSWEELRYHIVNALEKLEEKDDKIANELAQLRDCINKKLNELNADVRELKVKASWYGAIAGAVIVIASIVFNYLTKG